MRARERAAGRAARRRWVEARVSGDGAAWAAARWVAVQRWVVVGRMAGWRAVERRERWEVAAAGGVELGRGAVWRRRYGGWCGSGVGCGVGV